MPFCSLAAARSLALAGAFAALALAFTSCTSLKTDLQRDQVEQEYHDGRIDRVTYEAELAQIAQKEAAAQGQPAPTGNATVQP